VALAIGIVLAMGVVVADESRPAMSG